MNRAALFDADGTLADTYHLHVVCWWEALRQAGHDVAMHDMHRAIGLPATASSDDVDEGKPAPDPVHHALGLADAPAQGAVVVGDTVWDMQAGSRAGVVCVGLLCGGIPRRDLEEAGARAVYRHPADLLAHIDNSPFADRSGK